MKVVLMCGGKGTRMLPLTEKVPKTLISIGGRPFLYYLLTNLKKAGFTEFGIIAGYKKDQIVNFCEENDFNVTFIDQPVALGTGDAVARAKNFTKDEQFIVCSGDGLWYVEDFKRLNQDDDFIYTLALEVPNPEHYGVFQCDGEFLINIVEKPKEFVGNLINTGLYKFTPDIYKELEKVNPQPNGEYYLTDAITALAKKRKVKVISIKDYWKDLGKLEDIEPMEKFISEEWSG